MTFTTGIFIIGLLPWFVMLYNWLGNNKIWTRRILLILANSIFFMWGGAGSFLIICAFSVLVWLFSLFIFKTKSKCVFAISLLGTLAPLVFVKYAII